MKRTLIPVLSAAALATVAAIGAATPAYANSRTIELHSPSGALHATLNWNDTTDTLCLTLKSGAAGAVAHADMRLATTGANPQYLDASPSRPRSCTGNLSIPEDRLAEMRLYGNTNTWSNTTGWQQFYT